MTVNVEDPTVTLKDEMMYVEDVMMSPTDEIQGYLPHKKRPNPAGPPWDPSHRPTVGS